MFQVVLYRTVHFSNATFSLRAIIWNTSFNYFVQPILENTGLVLLVQVYWSRLRLSSSTLPQGDKASDQYLWPGGNLCILKLLKVRLIHAAFVIWLGCTSTTTDCSFLKTLLLSGWNAFLCHASISGQSVATVESEQIGYLHDDQRESPDMKNVIKESTCDSEKFTITQAQAFAQLPLPFLNSRAQLKAFVSSLC